MKRCPECLFIYPDSDTRCDFDGTQLLAVNEAELEAATSQAPAKRKRATKPKKPTKKRQRKATAITAVVGLLLGVAAFTIYYRFASHTENVSQLQSAPIASAEPIAASIPTPPVLEAASPSPTALPTPASKPTNDRIATAHTNTTVAPISTSGPGIGKKPGAKPVIVLTSGSKLEADEVWRTRDGVWYRRDGIVTLLKRGRVKAIVNQ
jgi:hypothetical protein